MKSACLYLAGIVLAAFPPTVLAIAAQQAPTPAPVRMILDTDMGNDVEDVFALGLVHALAARGECELLAVTLTKADPLAASYIDAVNTFYGRPDIPIATLRRPIGPGDNRFLSLAEIRDGAALRYPHDVPAGAATPTPVALLRQVLSQAADRSLVLVQNGFFSNFADLLDSVADEHSPLGGRELIRQKVRLLSVMAGAFQPIEGNARYREFNVEQDIPAARKVARDWPTPIVWSGFEIGAAVTFSAARFDHDFGYVSHHPLAESYRLYCPPPHERPMWDDTAVLQAVRTDAGYFDLSPPGRVIVAEDGSTHFAPEADGRDRYLILSAAQQIRVRECLSTLCTQPPSRPAR